MSGGRVDRSWDCPILHVDMDAFFASVALRDRPDLQHVPAAVGGGHRGVVLSANYAARAHGVRGGMSGVRARRLCPQLVCVPGDHATFSAVSTALREIFRGFTPQVEMASLDEAFLDVRGATRLLGSPLAIAEQIRATVLAEQGITCSAGVAPTVSVAKIASRRAKPDGVLVVPPEDVVDFLHALDVGELYGVGDATATKLRRAGLRTVRQLAHAPVGELRAAVGSGAAHQLQVLAWGRDRSRLHERRGPQEPDRSMGSQRTFARDLTDREEVLREILGLATKVTRRLRAGSVAGRTVALTVRYTDFTTLTRSQTLPEPTDVTQEVYAAAVALHDALVAAAPGGRRGRRAALRLVGVRVEGLVPRTRVHRQRVLGEREHGWSDADRAVDRAAGRFGSGVVGPASLLRLPPTTAPTTASRTAPTAAPTAAPRGRGTTPEGAVGRAGDEFL
ncbi:DNA polymerase IV [Nocardioides abyssi]|uniref:DNA polymerase IV n=1 Tax=Nocardioides abyssi TaxID=3058370 RepID=A0ABT8EYC7_9ACTN|nr:DNA polymerase IV [Nocardioides abyssi]MDN4163197.1 DNA polymerase IV [Nocardioides abyssi]